MKKPELLISQDPDVPDNRLFISTVKEPIEEGETLLADNIEVNYAEDSSIGATFFGWGIIKMLVSKGRQVAITVRDASKVVFPESHDED